MTEGVNSWETSLEGLNRSWQSNSLFTFTYLNTGDTKGRLSLWSGLSETATATQREVEKSSTLCRSWSERGRLKKKTCGQRKHASRVLTVHVRGLSLFQLWINCRDWVVCCSAQESSKEYYIHTVGKSSGECGHRSRYLSLAKRALYHLS